jgi:hypothetical protein
MPLKGLECQLSKSANSDTSHVPRQVLWDAVLFVYPGDK